MRAFLETVVALLGRHITLEDALREGVADGSPRQPHGAVDEDDVLGLRLQIKLLQCGSRIRFLARGEARPHLHAVGAHLYEINNVLTRENAARRYDGDVYGFADVGYQFAHGGVRTEVTAGFLALDDDRRGAKTL